MHTDCSTCLLSNCVRVVHVNHNFFAAKLSESDGENVAGGKIATVTNIIICQGKNAAIVTRDCLSIGDIALTLGNCRISSLSGLDVPLVVFVLEVVAANCWNPLPNEVKNAESLASFRRQLKTHLFKQAFLI